MQKYNHKITEILKSDKFYFYALSLVGVMSGIKLCDYIYYDEKKLMAIREKM